MKALWRLRFLGRNRHLRKLVSFGFHTVFRHGSVVKIRLGPLRGMRWVVHRDHQFWMLLGSYETETAAWLLEHLRPGDTFFDVGGNAGYFTLLGARAVGPSGRVHVFEPVPVNAATIERQVEINRLQNVTVHRVALCNRSGPVAFTVESSNPNSHMTEVDVVHFDENPTDRIEVEGRKLDEVAVEVGMPDVIKIDVEGAEVLVLEGASEALACHPRIVVSTHSQELRERCKELLERIGYEGVVGLAGFEHELIAERAGTR